MSYDGSPKAYPAVVLVILATIFTLIGIDVIADARAGGSPLHIAMEAGIMVLCLVGGIALWRELRGAQASVHRLEREVASAGAEAERWRVETRELLDGLALAIDRQFAHWNLTPAEREIGFLLLRGLSHKEVARMRATSERTVREQAGALYQKAGVGGKAGLAAFFLEGLLPPGGRHGGDSVGQATVPPRESSDR